MRPRFTIRTLLVLTALLAAGCYFWIVRPTIVANRFIAAVNRDDYAAAHKMFADPDPRYLGLAKGGHGLPGNWRARLFPRSSHELLHGYRAIEVFLTNGTYKFQSDFVRATARGRIVIVTYDDELYDELCDKFAAWQKQYRYEKLESTPQLQN